MMLIIILTKNFSSLYQSLDFFCIFVGQISFNEEALCDINVFVLDWDFLNEARRFFM